jgi:hypothetical protein
VKAHAREQKAFPTARNSSICKSYGVLEPASIPDDSYPNTFF